MSSPQFASFSLPREEDTKHLAAAMAPLLRAGDVILLEGSIGAGKTTFARALVQTRLAAANLSEDVPSPTFTIVQTYDDGKTEIWHADLYRLGAVTETDELGLLDAFETAICVVEWPDRLGTLAPLDALTIEFTADPETECRTAEFISADDDWHARLAKLGSADV